MHKCIPGKRVDVKHRLSIKGSICQDHPTVYNEVKQGSTSCALGPMQPAWTAERRCAALLCGCVLMLWLLNRLFAPTPTPTVELLPPMPLPDALQCLARIGSTGRDRWLAVYGDSLTRGVFFDVVTMLNDTSSAAAARSSPPHPGHSANYSEGCLRLERRPPINRLKCGAFAYEMPFTDPAATHRAGQLLQGPDWPPPRGRGAAARLAHRGQRTLRRLRLSYRLKTFTWEPAFDSPWLAELGAGTRLPDVLLLGFGIWDMQYPPDGEPSRGLGAFARSVEAFLAVLDETVRAVQRKQHQLRPAGGRPPRPRLLWLTVAAVSDSRLPSWKRPRMSAALAARYNEAAEPVLRRHGVQVIDTFSSGRAHPQLSPDGIHFPGAVSRHHTQLVLRAVCDG